MKVNKANQFPYQSAVAGKRQFFVRRKQFHLGGFAAAVDALKGNQH